MTAYEPGAFVVATVRGVPNVRLMATSTVEWVTMAGYVVSDRDGDTTGNVTDIRPLVTIDPEDPEQVERLARAWDDLADEHATLTDKPMTLSGYRMQAALRSLIAPPKPAEPTDPAARVIDCCGDVWASHDGKWGCITDGADPTTWPDLVKNFGPLEIRP